MRKKRHTDEDLAREWQEGYDNAMEKVDRETEMVGGIEQKHANGQTFRLSISGNHIFVEIIEGRSYTSMAFPLKDIILLMEKMTAGETFDTGLL